MRPSRELGQSLGHDQEPQNENDEETGGYGETPETFRRDLLAGRHIRQYIAGEKKGPSHRAPTGQLRGCVRSEFFYFVETMLAGASLCLLQHARPATWFLAKGQATPPAFGSTALDFAEVFPLIADATETSEPTSATAITTA
jgi:hypothetical protein